MSDGDGFLARWSRRKRAEVEPGRDAPPAPPAAPAEEELAPEELAALPSIEAITAETDITGFLRRGVPRALRNAALKQVWLSDPAIRDRVGDALDYAWDFNVPGEVPGFGPIEPDLDVAGMVRSMFSRPADETAPAQIAEAPAEAVPEVASHRAEPLPDIAEPDGPETRLPPARLDEAGSPLAAEPVEVEPPPPQPRRRHGGAMPL